ncbi:MAG: AAA family ATPase [Synergistota bacterium]|nr:AAA family ATPase [Synergistota bacterium]
MLEKIKIKNFKCFRDISLPLTYLNVLTGPNSGGKSTVLQAILLASSGFSQDNRPALKEVIKPYLSFKEILCHQAEERRVAIELFLKDEGSIAYFVGDDGSTAEPMSLGKLLEYEQSLFYLSSGRIGPEEIAKFDEELHIGSRGQFAMGWFERVKDNPIDPALRMKEAPSQTLKKQLAWWLSYITDKKMDVETEKITASEVVVKFVVGEDQAQMSPYNVGSGNGYLSKLLIMGLTSHPGDLLLVENPEIHLHPAAQSRVGIFLAFLAEKGVQLLVETHCEHLIHRLRYAVFEKMLSPENLRLFYIEGDEGKSVRLDVDENGHLRGVDGKEELFPKGFFDVSLKRLLEMG